MRPTPTPHDWGAPDLRPGTPDGIVVSRKCALCAWQLVEWVAPDTGPEAIDNAATGGYCDMPNGTAS